MQARGLTLGMVAMALLASCNSRAPEISEAKRKEMQFDRIAKLEDQSCLCAMAGRDTAKLDGEIKRLTASLKKQESTTSSVPLRGDSTCYPELGDRACTGRVVVTHSTSDRDFVCSEKQADELLAVFDAAAPDDGTIEGWNKTRKKRDDALLTRIKAMHAEAAAKIPQSACN
jgi:hypothetical protein